MNDNIKSKETEVYNNGLSRTCKYRDFSMNRVCYFGNRVTEIINCIGCHEDGRNAENGTDATKFAEKFKAELSNRQVQSPWVQDDQANKFYKGVQAEFENATEIIDKLVKQFDKGGSAQDKLQRMAQELVDEFSNYMTPHSTIIITLDSAEILDSSMAAPLKVRD